MADYNIFNATTHRQEIQASQETVYLYIRGHTPDAANPLRTPPTTGSISSDTGFSTDKVNHILRSLLRTDGVKELHDTLGAPSYWSIVTVEALYMLKLAAARSWIDEPLNNGKTVSQMAGVLGIHEALAVHLMRQLAAEHNAVYLPV